MGPSWALDLIVKRERCNSCSDGILARVDEHGILPMIMLTNGRHGRMHHLKLIGSDSGFWSASGVVVRGRQSAKNTPRAAALDDPRLEKPAREGMNK